MIKTGTHSMEDVLKYVGEAAGGNHADASKAMFYFLYKEILVNRIAILESDPSQNRASIEHNERLINELNEKLMRQIEAH